MNIIDARVIQKTDTEDKWLQNELTLYKGELALVQSGNQIVNIKVGTGRHKFRDLPYLINYTSGLYTKAITPSSYPSGDAYQSYIVTEAGAYTNFGGVVLPKDNIGVIYKNLNQYTISLLPIVSEDALKEFINERLVDANLGFGGQLTDLSQAPIVQGMYIPRVEGVYPNFGGLEYDSSEGLVIFLYKDNEYTKISIPLDAVDEEVRFNNEVLGVSGKAVEKFAVKKINNIAELRNTQGEYEGQIIELLGYYEAGEYSLKYKWTDTQGVDDLGSVINSGSGSWLIVAGDEVSIRYFGITNDLNIDFTNNLININKYCTDNYKILDFEDCEFSIYNTLNIDCRCAESGAKINVPNKLDRAINVNSKNTTLRDLTFKVPSVIANKTSTGYSTVGDGVYLNNLYSCRIYTSRISNFNKGLVLDANNNSGNVYNTILIGHLENNKENLVIKPSSTKGWVNENLFVGGRCSKFSSEIRDGLRKIEIVDGGINYSSSPTIVHNNLSEGATAPTYSITVTNGVITAVNILTKGSGLTRDYYITLTDTTGVGATLRTVISEEGSSHISIYNGETYVCDNNTFLHVSIEGDNVENHLYCEGSTNKFDHCRWEAVRPKALFYRNQNLVSAGRRNFVDKGFGAENLFVENTGNGQSLYNTIDRNSNGKNIEAMNQSLRLRSSNASSAIRIYNSVANFNNRGVFTYNSDKSWSTDIGHFGLETKAQNDAFARVRIDGQTGQIRLGTGANENMSIIQCGEGSPEGVVSARIGSIYMNILGTGSTDSNIWQKTTGQGSNIGWKLLTAQPNAETNKRGLVLQSVAVANTTTADATDLATALVLINELKVKLNAKLTADRNSGQQAT